MNDMNSHNGLNADSDQNSPIPAPSRREFLTRSSLALGAAALLSSTGTARKAQAATAEKPLIGIDGPKLADGETIKMGLIGTGGMGTGHCQAFVSLNKDKKENVQVIALADVCDSRLNGAKEGVEKEQGGKVETYRDYKKLLARDDLHGVLIASPEHWHSQMAIDAILAGKDVYLEKPMCLNLVDALKLRKVVLDNPSRVLQVGTQQMQLPKFLEAKRLVKEGIIGKPTFSQTSYCRNSKDGEWLYYGIDKDWKPGVNLDWDAWCGPLGAAPWNPEIYARWRRYRKYSTGIIGDLLVHVMTPLMVALDMGWPTRVVGSGLHLIDKKMENFDQVNLTIEFEKEHVMMVVGSTCNEVGLEAMIRGHKGNIYLGSNNVTVRPERIFSEELETQEIKCADIGNDQDQHRLNWLKCIRTRQQPDANVDVSTKVMVAVDLATRSMWEGKAFAFEPAKMESRAVC